MNITEVPAVADLHTGQYGAAATGRRSKRAPNGPMG